MSQENSAKTHPNNMDLLNDDQLEEYILDLQLEAHLVESYLFRARAEVKLRKKREDRTSPVSSTAKQGQGKRSVN